MRHVMMGLWKPAVLAGGCCVVGALLAVVDGLVFHEQISWDFVIRTALIAAVIGAAVGFMFRRGNGDHAG